MARALLDTYVGTYGGPPPEGNARLGDTADWVVTLEGDQLMIQMAARDKAPLFAESDTRFFVKKTHLDVEFAKDPQGAVKYLFILRDGAPA